MKAQESDAQERTDLQITVCENGVVNVRNPEYDRGHTYSVHLTDDGSVDRCTCKGHTYHGHCYHADEVESRPLIVSSAESLAESYERVAADGGVTTNDSEGETCSRCPTLLADSHDQPAGFTAITLDGDELCSDCADDYYERDGCTCEDCQ